MAAVCMAEAILCVQQCAVVEVVSQLYSVLVVLNIILCQLCAYVWDEEQGCHASRLILAASPLTQHVLIKQCKSKNTDEP